MQTQPLPTPPANLGHNQNARFSKLFRDTIDSIRQIEEQKKALGKTVKEKKAQLKEQGFSTMAINQLLRELRLEKEVRQHFREDTHICRDAYGEETTQADQVAYEDPDHVGKKPKSIKQVAKEKAAHK